MLKKISVSLTILIFSNNIYAKSDPLLIEISTSQNKASSSFDAVPETLISQNQTSASIPQESLPLFFKSVPGVLSEPVFGGVDHPRLSIRGSGIQRGTQPAGRGIELRFNGIPVNYADTSYDFVEWLDPSDYQQVDVVRGGRAASIGGVTLGGVINFISPRVRNGLTGSANFQAGSFGKQQRTIQVAYGEDQASYSVLASNYEQDGFREHNQQSAQRFIADLTLRTTSALEASIQAIHSNSNLELPGPQRLSEINIRSRAAQPGNIRGNWRRESRFEQINFNLVNHVENPWGLSLAFTHRDIDFIRQDIQIERSHGITLSAWHNRIIDINTINYNQLIAQYDDRDLEQFFNGGGTIPTFSGEPGAQWANNRLESSRMTWQTGLSHSVDENFKIFGHIGFNQHIRVISDQLDARPNGLAADAKLSFSNFSGIIGADYQVNRILTFFTALSHVTEPPTLDVLLVSTSGLGKQAVINEISDQEMFTAETGFHLNHESVNAEMAVYRSWLKDEIVSTADAANAQITSIGNARRTERLGAELLINALVSQSVFRDHDQLKALLNWNWVQATFDNDASFKNNKLPVVTPHTIFSQISYIPFSALEASLNVKHVPRGAFVDYQNTFRDREHTVFGARIELKSNRWSSFVDVSNINNTTYAATVIGAQNNTRGNDGLFFAPGESRAFTIGTTYFF